MIKLILKYYEEYYKKKSELRKQNIPNFYCNKYSNGSSNICNKQCFDCSADVGERRIQTRQTIQNRNIKS